MGYGADDIDCGCGVSVKCVLLFGQLTQSNGVRAHHSSNGQTKIPKCDVPSINNVHNSINRQVGTSLRRPFFFSLIVQNFVVFSISFLFKALSLRLVCVGHLHKRNRDRIAIDINFRATDTFHLIFRLIRSHSKTILRMSIDAYSIRPKCPSTLCQWRIISSEYWSDTKPSDHRANTECNISKMNAVE